MFNKRTKLVLIEFLIYSFFFFLTIIFFPICSSYDLSNVEPFKITHPHFLIDFWIAYFFPLFFVSIIVGFLSLKKWLIIVFNIIVLLLLIAIYFLIELSFTWSGGPFRPNFELGYWFSQLFLILLIIRTFNLTSKLNRFKISKKTTFIFTCLAISIPILTVSFLMIKHYF